MEKNFETALKELEEIVFQFEEGRLTLDEAVQAYEKGTQLQKYCKKRLEEARMKIEHLIEDSSSADQQEKSESD